MMDDVNRFSLHRSDKPAGITAVGIDALDELEARPGPAKHALGAVSVLHVGGVEPDRQQTAVGVGQDVPLASMDRFLGVVAPCIPL